MPNILAVAGKTVVGFVGLILTNLVVNWTSMGTPLPLNTNGTINGGLLLANILTTVIGTLGVYQFPMPEYNKPVAGQPVTDTTGKHEK